MATLTKLHGSQGSATARRPQRLNMMVAALKENGLMTDRMAENYGGLMNDGNFFYPMNGNCVFYYNLFTQCGYILRIKKPTELESKEIEAIRMLLHSDATEAGARDFLNKWRENYYKDHPGEGFPLKLLPYLPYGCYDHAPTIVQSTTEYRPMRDRKDDNYYDSNYYWGKNRPVDAEAALAARQIAYGREYERNRRKNNGNGTVDLDEVCSKAIELVR